MSLNRILGIIIVLLTLAAAAAACYLVFTYGFGVFPVF